MYWLNLFGPPYVDLVGAETLRSSPAHRIEETGHATIVETYRDPSGWSKDEGKTRHAAVLAHLGPEFFFDRASPEQTTRAPDFGLPPLAPRPPFQVFTTDGKHFTPIPPAAGEPPAAGPSDPRP